MKLHPFHWELEFPEVFAGEAPGFDAFVGNPPFAGKNTLINGNRDHYLDWLLDAARGRARQRRPGGAFLPPLLPDACAPIWCQQGGARAAGA